MKNHTDLISCTKIPETTELCFLDDVFHPGMVNDRIYYINIKPYIYDIPFDTMIDRLVNSQIFIKIDQNVLENMKSYILKYMKNYNYTYVEKTKDAQDIDKILSKQILYNLHIFFNKTTNKYTARKFIQNKRTKTKKKK